MHLHPTMHCANISLQCGCDIAMVQQKQQSQTNLWPSTTGLSTFATDYLIDKVLVDEWPLYRFPT